MNSTLWAQTGPGGVSSGAKLWVKADQGVTTSLANVSLWTDQSGSGNNAAQGTAAHRPDLNPVVTNYRPSIYFNGNNDNLTLNDLIAAGSTSVSIFAVGSNESGGDAWHSLFAGQASGAWIFGGYGLTAFASNNATFGFWVNSYLANQAGNAWIDQPMAILEGGYGSGSLEYYRNAGLIGSDSYSGIVGDIGTTTIGGGPGTSNSHKGYISEIAVYDRKLSAAERLRVNSYLSLKYGITMNRAGSGGNYVRSNGNGIYSDGGVATYWNGVIGIGRDDNSGLVQRQSRSASDSVRLYLGTLAASNAANTSNFSANNQFIVAGHDAKATCITDASGPSRPTGIAARMPRTFKVVNTGYSGTFTLEVQLGNCGLTGTWAPADLRLLVDNDGDFTDATVFAPGGGLSISVVGGYVRVSGIGIAQLPANATRYLTLGVSAYAPPTGPGGVLAGNVFWSKANAGVTITTGKVSGWADQSGGGNNAVQGNSAYRPTWSAVRNNYNPSLYFNGNDDHLTMNDLIAAGSQEVSVFAVGTNESGGDAWHSMVLGQSYSGWTGGGYGICSMDASSSTMGFWVNNYGTYRAFTAWADRPMAINEGEYGSGSLQFYQNSLLAGSSAYNGIVGDNGTTHIGGGDATNYNHKGHIAEVIIFKTKLAASERYKVNSYLGLKYGLTLDRTGNAGKYVDSRGTAVYSDAGIATYWHDIIGIGRDDSGTLLQRQSHTVDDSTRLYIASLSASNAGNTGTFSGDRQFVVMGHNNGRLCATTASNSEKPDGIASRIEREWKVTKTGFSGSFNVDIQLGTCSNLSNIATADLRLLVDDDGDFGNAVSYASGGSMAISRTAGLVTISGIPVSVLPNNGTRYFTLGSASAATPLPITLLAFNATPMGQEVHLDWSTASEQWNDHFTVERSTDAAHWVDVASVPGAGNSSTVLHYAAVDGQPLQGISYYRLAQTDFNGTTTTSQMVVVRMEGTVEKALVMPNPASDQVAVVFTTGSPEDWRLTLSDPTGRTIAVPITTTGTGYSLDVRELTSGIYALRFEGQGRSWVQQLLVRH